MQDDEEKGPLGKAIDKAQDAVGSVVGMASANTMGRSTDGFTHAAAIADMYEIAAGSLAVERGASQSIRAFGSTLKQDHEKSLQLLISKLDGGGPAAELPTGMDERRAGMIDNLRAAGDDFDTVFLQQQTAAHQEALALHRRYAEHGDDALLRGLADGMIPKLEQHAQMAAKLAAERQS